MKTFWIVLFIVLALLSALFSFTLLQFDPNTSRPQLEAHLGQVLAADVQIGAVSLKWNFLPEISFTDLKITERGSGELLMRAERANARVRLWPLLRKEFWAVSFQLESPHFSFVRSSGKTWNWNAALFSGPAKAPETSLRKVRGAWSFHLGSLEARQASVDYEDRTHEPYFRLNLRRLQVRTSSLDPLSAFMLWFEMPAGGLPLTGTIRVDRNTQALNFTSKLGESFLTSEIEITRLFTEPRFEFKAMAQSLPLEDLGQLSKAFPLTGKVSGAWEGTGGGLHPSDWGRTLILNGTVHLEAGELKEIPVVRRVFQELAEIPIPGLAKLPNLDYSFDFDGILKGTRTPFEDIEGKVQWTAEKLFFNDMVLKSRDYSVQMNGSFQGRDKYADFRGAIAFSEEVSRLILSEIPEMDVLKNLQNEVLVPVEYRGTYPRGDIFVDHDFIANRFVQMHGEILASLGIQKLNDYLEAHRT